MVKQAEYSYAFGLQDGYKKMASEESVADAFAGVDPDVHVVMCRSGKNIVLRRREQPDYTVTSDMSQFASVNKMLEQMEQST